MGYVTMACQINECHKGLPSQEKDAPVLKLPTNPPKLCAKQLPPGISSD